MTPLLKYTQKYSHVTKSIALNILYSWLQSLIPVFSSTHITIFYEQHQFQTLYSQPWQNSAGT